MLCQICLEAHCVAMWSFIFCGSCYDIQTWRPYNCLPQLMFCKTLLSGFPDSVMMSPSNHFQKKPSLQPLTGEILELKTANHQEEAMADIHAKGQ